MRNDKLIVDFTEGNIIKQMLTFSLPFMLSNMMQVLYSFVDMAVVGKYVGPPGLSAVSIASQPMMFITMFCVGITTGGQVNISHQIGRKEYKAVSRTIGTMFSVLAILGVVMMCVGFIGATPMLHILNAPEESFEMAKMYIIVCSAGILFTYGYNMLSAVLRGMGDSKHPFIFIVIASISNVVLDLLFVGVFKMGVQGAALATILGQGISFVFAIVFLFRHKEEFYFDFKPESFRIYRSPFRALIRLGIPFALDRKSVV